MKELPNFDEILEKRIHIKNEEIFKKLQAKKRLQERREKLRRHVEQNRKRRLENERKQFRSLNFEKVVQNCLDYVVNTTSPIFSRDVHQIVILRNENWKAFFTEQDIEEILDGLVQKGFLKCELTQDQNRTYLYVPRTLEDTEVLDNPALC